MELPDGDGTRKIGPAMAAGCSVVLKPASETPLTTLAIGAILHEPGCPAGVVNVRHHVGPAVVSERCSTTRRVRKLSFTGSTAVGRDLLHGAADRVVSCSMELGGNAPFLVFADADLDAAVDGRDGRQDAQQRRGLHGGQPLLRPRRGGRRVRHPAGRAMSRLRVGRAPTTASSSAR